MRAHYTCLMVGFFTGFIVATLKLKSNSNNRVISMAYALPAAIKMMGSGAWLCYNFARTETPVVASQNRENLVANLD